MFAAPEERVAGGVCRYAFSPQGEDMTAINVSAYLGIDVGSVTTKFAILDSKMVSIARAHFAFGRAGIRLWHEHRLRCRHRLLSRSAGLSPQPPGGRDRPVGSTVRLTGAIAGRCTVFAESDMIHDWDDISGEMIQLAPQPSIHGCVWCMDVQGEIAHLHAHGDSAHWIKGLRCQEGQQPKNRFDNSFRI